MRDGGYNLGGEQSGHVIFADYATTGDSVLTGLQLAAQVALTGKPLKELAAVMTKLPQVLINVKGVDRTRVNRSGALAQAVTVAETELGDTGRVLLRPSGTEPVVRVMVEAGDEATAQSIAERLAQVVRTELALELVTD
jgi:phosphoglucosamine mutase